jgi:Na+/H+ antiporter NhaD/arsenite permease-like protein
MLAAVALVFVLGYVCIAFEHAIKVDKSATAILTAVLCWTLLAFAGPELAPLHEMVQGTAQHATDWVPTELRHHLSEIAEILFFLMGAMVIVELIDAHRGFSVVTERISTRKQSTLLWLIGLLTFFLSAALDNLTTTIVMISLLRKLIAQQQQRWVYAGVVVIAANAGGAWSPIGDVTTTMLWIGNQITTLAIVKQLILPSLVCLLVPLLWLSLRLKGEVERPLHFVGENDALEVSLRERQTVFVLGIGALLFVPVFKTVTHLPPYMGILFGLGVLWVVTELMHHGKDDEQRHPLTVAGVLRRIDTPSILFFLGILLAVSALSTAGHLTAVAGWLRDSLGNVYAINVAIGLLSAVVDNVPLVAGAMKMYPLLPAEAVTGPQADWLQHFVQDGTFWEMLAYCAGTGGSCLIIGSAAGVAAMGMEKISFGWYLRHISGLALMGYLAGAGVYIVLHTLG